MNPTPASPQNRWRHIKRGSTYIAVGMAEMQCEDGEPFHDYELVMVYRCEADGKLWVRRKSEFEDGRFEALPSPPSDDRAEMDALLRAAFPESWEQRSGNESFRRILAWHRAEKAAAVADITADRDMWLEIVANLSATMTDIGEPCPCDRCQALAKISENQHRLPKTTEQRSDEVIAAARKAAFHAGREDMAKEGWPIRELEAAEAAALKSAIRACAEENNIEPLSGALDRAIDRIDALISPISQSALSSQLAATREAGRKEGLGQIVRLFRQRAYVAGSLYGDAANARKVMLRELAADIERMTSPPQPAQGAKETQS